MGYLLRDFDLLRCADIKFKYLRVNLIPETLGQASPQQQNGLG